MTYWLRWVGVLPISIIAGVLITFPVHWGLYQTLSGGDSPLVSPYPELPERILQPFFSALTIVWVSSLIAPKYKFKTSVTLAVIWIFIVCVLFYLGYSSENIQMNLNAGGLPIISGIIGSFVGVYLVKKNLTENQKALL